MNSRNTLRPTNLAPIETDSLDVGGAARWRGTTTVGWRRGSWSGSLGAYYAGETTDTGATVTAAQYESLGRPSYIAKQFTAGNYQYRYVMGETLTYNLAVGYQFGARPAGRGGDWLRKTKVRLGVVNIFNEEPPLASGAFGYSPGVTGNLAVGRTWNLELTRSF
jgi:iron complex outermembrane recepter protein